VADDYTRANEIFRAKEVASKKMPIHMVGEHVRVHDGIQSLTLSGTAATLTVPSGATHALIYAEGSADTDYARYWHGATNPTNSVGKKLKDHEEISSASPANFRAINGAGTVTLRVEYYHYE
jgi:hypothetical protein